MIYRCLVATLLMVGSASAQNIIDEPKGIDANLAKQIASDVAEQFTDPLSTQFRRMQQLPDQEGVICGQVNTKNLYGGYIGFKPFRYIVDKRKVYLENSRCE